MREIGAWGKWENAGLHQSSLELSRLCRSKVGGQDENKLQLLARDTIQAFEFEDVMHVVRKDWRGMEVFTIDDPDAYEICNGISLKRVSDNWVHVHITNTQRSYRKTTGSLRLQ